MLSTQTFRVVGTLTPAAVDRVRLFVDAVRDGVGLGLVGQPGAAPRPICTTRVDWSPDGIVTAVLDAPGLSAPSRDEDLFRRGVANCLDMAGCDILDGAPVAPDIRDEYAEALRVQRARWAIDVVDDGDVRHEESSHVYVEFSAPVEPGAFAVLARAVSVFERLVWGMYPLAGDVYSDIGDTAMTRAEPAVIDYWMDAVLALEPDWKRRLEAMFLLNAPGVRSIRYEQ